MDLSKYSIGGLIELKEKINAEIDNRKYPTPDYIRSASNIPLLFTRNHALIDMTIDWYNIMDPIMITSHSTNKIKRVQTVDQISHREYLIKTTEYGDSDYNCDYDDEYHIDFNSELYDNDSNFTYNVKVIDKRYVNLTILRVIINKLFPEHDLL
jgi:hypothetical protein